MADMWREDDDWRRREGREWRADEPYGGRRFGEGDYGYRTGQRYYPNYGYSPDWGRYHGERGGYPGDFGRAPYGAGLMGYPTGHYGTGGAYGYRGEDYRREPYAHSRDWMDRAGDEVSSWFGDEEAARRREMDRRRGGHYGRGPRGYRRSDERITEDINDRLTDDWQLDASDIEVSVADGEVTLSGSVENREDKRRAEDLAESVSGVRDVQNNIRVTRGAAGMADERAGSPGREAGTGTRAH
jgi:osmotically-inducible protein OsmY